jgi:hypothetical protein
VHKSQRARGARLAAALRCNSTLHKLRLNIRLAVRRYAFGGGDELTDPTIHPAVAAAVAALRSMSRAPAAPPLAVTVVFCEPAGYYGGGGYGGGGEE